MIDSLRNYVKKYNRIVMVSDYVSHEVSDIIFDNILDVMKNKYENSVNLYGNEFYVFDENNDISKFAVPRSVMYDTFMEKIKPDDGFFVRCEYYCHINGSSSLPIRILYNCELCIYVVKNTLSIHKDRYIIPHEFKNGIDLRNVGKSFKLNKILNRINHT